MPVASTIPGPVELSAQVLSTIFFSLTFLFLWRRSRILFFAFWSIAWAMRSLALVFVFCFFSTGARFWLAPYLLCECTFGIALITAARLGPAGSGGNWRSGLKLLALLPVFVAIFFLSGWQLTLSRHHGLNALLTAAVYLYSYSALGGGLRAGGKFFRYSLLVLSVAFFGRALLAFLAPSADPGMALAGFERNPVFDIVLHSILVISAMAMWVDNQGDRLQQIGDELDRVRRESLTNLDLDRLTGLLNQAALAKRLDGEQSFKGVVAVCDMDNFKHVKDRYGHLVGDEILRAAGRLLRSSIRNEDEAFRWGGDEFVILFHSLSPIIVRSRMDEIQARLQDFRVRGHGALPVSFSWGMAECDSQPLRQFLDEADHGMYESKRRRSPVKDS